MLAEALFEVVFFSELADCLYKSKTNFFLHFIVYHQTNFFFGSLYEGFRSYSLEKMGWVCVGVFHNINLRTFGVL
jgi:hypothetical protein